MSFSLGGALGGGALFGGMGATLGGFAGDLFGTKQGTIQTENSFNNTSSSSPWAPAAPYITSGLGYAQNIYNQNQAPNSLFNLGQNQAAQTLSGAYLNPESNPYLKSAVQDALGLAGSSFAGQYGGAAGNNLGNSGYQEGLARTLGQVATNAYSNAYGQERQNQVNAIPFGASLPYANLAGYNAGISPALSYGTNTSSGTGTNQTPYYQNNTATTLGALAGGASIAKMFSDRRLKTDIVKLGDDPRGFGLYEFTIFGERKRGVMADEIEKIIPEAVSEMHGFKVVDYGRL